MISRPVQPKKSDVPGDAREEEGAEQFDRRIIKNRYIIAHALLFEEFGNTSESFNA